jgi:hypothetical protein
MGNRADAADAVIVEVEQDRDQARAELAQLQARDRAERSAPDAEHAAMNRHLDRMRTRAEQAEAALARVRNARTLGDALATVAEHDGMPPETARVHGRILDQGDAVEARLAEQQRAHEIELATARRALSDTETIGHRLLQRAERAEGRLAQVERRADISEQQAETLRREVNRAEEDARAEHRRGDGWKRHALDTDHKADRYRTAWFAARRDRKADRAAMAAELPLIEAGRAALARVALDRADLLAALTR